MDVREKLVELIGSTKYGNGSLVRNNFQKGFIEKIATHLVANGVTVQEWISVKDRLPEEKGRYLTANKRCGDKIVVFDLWFGGGFWYVEEEDDVFDFEVTHWMPMPEPPKGE